MEVALLVPGSSSPSRSPRVGKGLFTCRALPGEARTPGAALRSFAALGTAWASAWARRRSKAVIRFVEHPDQVAFCPPSAYAPEAEDLDYWPYPEYDFNYEAWDMDGYLELLKEASLCGDWQHAASLLEEMRSHGLVPDVSSYALVLRACRRGVAGSKASEVLEEMWKKELLPTCQCYADAIAACHQEGREDLVEYLRSELRALGPAPEVQRFQLVPKIGWGKELALMGCGAHNSIAWDGKGALPFPSNASCWLVPSQDEAAVAIAENAAALRERGWKLLTCDPKIVDVLRNKGKLRTLAASLGLLSLLPQHFDFFSDATYPCILKPAIGTFGKNTYIVESKEQAMRLAPDGLDETWILQELITGELEYSTTLLVLDGKILDWAGMKYQYSMEAYVWPHVRLVDQELCSVPAEHRQLMEKFLVGFSGICNFNFKLREDGTMCIFEVNPRVGGDLAFDLPKPRARSLLEKMDAMAS
ncbi:Hypothetical protein SCF082_LOCUS35768 [Durusdinium trenchii]|uniref:ATP-grasp domain-containing protein n=1 Tax=Durusdinium trenchii TaxID=1381693 RepID=A0ABP0P8C6_9DINO